MTVFYNYHLTHLVTSAPDVYHLPIDYGIEIAFVGHSNAGKSSVLNTLVNQKGLFRTSKIPGRTQFINLFEITSGVRLADLPGYGYATMPKELKDKWQSVLVEYLQMRNSLKGLVVSMDIRHPMKALDKQVIQLAINIAIPVLVLLTKADKLALGECKAKLNQVRLFELIFMGDVQVEVFSSLKKYGVDKLQKKLDDWFCRNSASLNTTSFSMFKETK